MLTMFWNTILMQEGLEAFFIITGPFSEYAYDQSLKANWL